MSSVKIPVVAAPVSAASSAAALNRRSMIEYTLVLLGGMGFSFNAGYINGCCLMAFDNPGGVKQSVAGFTGAYTQTALHAAAGDGFDSRFQLSMILCFILGSAIVGASASRRSAWELVPEYGPLFMLGSVFLAASTLMAHYEDERGRGVFYFAAMATGLQNGMTSLYSQNLIRTTHLTGTSTDIGLFLGQLARGHYKNAWKLKVLVALAVSFSLGALTSYWAVRELGSKALIINCVLFALIGCGYLVVVAQKHKISVLMVLLGRWDLSMVAGALKRHYHCELSEIFDAIDSDGSGTIEPVELLQALIAAGEQVKRQTIERLFADADGNSDGVMDREEFAQMMASHLHATEGDYSGRLKLMRATSMREQKQVRADESETVIFPVAPGETGTDAVGLLSDRKLVL